MRKQLCFGHLVSSQINEGLGFIVCLDYHCVLKQLVSLIILHLVSPFLWLILLCVPVIPVQTEGLSAVFPVREY
jgi:hypothetical protein